MKKETPVAQLTWQHRLQRVLDLMAQMQVDWTWQPMQGPDGDLRIRVVPIDLKERLRQQQMQQAPPPLE